jgi:hypothetical protein
LQIAIPEPHADVERFLGGRPRKVMAAVPSS